MMQKLYQVYGLLAALILSANVYAGDVQIVDAWSRATAPGQDVASVDMSITSKQPAILIGASSKACRVVELHRMIQEDGMMKMREVRSIELQAERRVDLGKSGYHLMLVGLKAPLKAGEKIPLVLTVKLKSNRTVKVDVTAEVKPITATKAPSQEDEHQHMKMN